MHRELGRPVFGENHFLASARTVMRSERGRDVVVLEIDDHVSPPLSLVKLFCS
jgi:hypothetical protein